MVDAAPSVRIILLGAPPLAGELIASYFRFRFKNAVVERCFSMADLDRSADEPTAFVLYQASAPANAHNVAQAVAHVRSGFAQSAILVAAASPSPAAAAEAFRCGAQGFVPRVVPISVLGDALRTVLAGGTCFPHSDGPTQAPFQRSPARGHASEAAHGSTLLRRAEGQAPQSSVELALMSAEIEGRFVGPCRRRGTGEGWRGPERRRAVGC